MNWSIFSTLVAQIEPPLLASVTAMIGALTGSLAGVLKAGITVWLAGHFLVRVLHPHGNPLSDLEGKLIRAAIFFVLATQAATYNHYVRDIFLTALPNSIASVITGSTGAAAISGASFDMIWNKAWVAGLAVYQSLGVMEIGLQILVVLYWIIALIAIGAGFLVWIVSKLLLALLVGTGPLFVGMMIFPATRSIFERWIGSLLSNIVLQVFTVALLTILIAAENTIVAQISTASATGITMSTPIGAALAMQATGGNAVQQLQLLLGGMLLFFICGLIVTQLPGAAASIAGGLAFHAGAIGGAAFGAAGGVFTRAGAAASAGINAVGSTTRAATSTVRAAGMSLSRARP